MGCKSIFPVCWDKGKPVNVLSPKKRKNTKALKKEDRRKPSSLEREGE